VKNDLDDFYTRISDLFSKKWFHGFVSETKLATLLTQQWSSSGRKTSYFAVCFSNDLPGQFTLVHVTTKGNIVYEKIFNREGTLLIESTKKIYNTWDAVKIACKSEWGISASLVDSPHKTLLKHANF